MILFDFSRASAIITRVDGGEPEIRSHRPDGREIKTNWNDTAVDPKSIFNANFANETNFTKKY